MTDNNKPPHNHDLLCQRCCTRIYETVWLQEWTKC